MFLLPRSGQEPSPDAKADEMVLGSNSITRREITGAAPGCACAIAMSPIQPTSATAGALVSDWTGLGVQPRWQFFGLIPGDAIVLPIYVGGISDDATLPMHRQGYA